MKGKFGKLFLIPTTLGPNEPLEVLPISVKKIVEDLDFFIVENEKSARSFIKKIAKIFFKNITSLLWIHKI